MDDTGHQAPIAKSAGGVPLRWTWALTGVVLGATAGAGGGALYPPRYRAAAYLYLVGSRMGEVRMAASEVHVLSRTLATLMTDDSSLDALAAECALRGSDGEPVPPERLRDRIEVEQRHNTTLLEVAVEWSSAEVAARTANALADRTVERLASLNDRGLQEAVAALGQEAVRARQRWDDARAELAAFEEKEDVDLKRTELDTTRARILELEEESIATGLELAQARVDEASTRGLMGSIPEKRHEERSLVEDEAYRLLLEHAGGTGAADSLRLRMRSEEINPNYVHLEGSVAGLRVRIQALEFRLGAVRDELEDRRRRYRELTGEVIRLAQGREALTREVSARSAAYGATAERLENTRLGLMGQHQVARVAEKAVPPARPVRLTLRLAALGALSGLLVAILAALLAAARAHPGARPGPTPAS
ncbi:MAG: hypothetical protein HY722_15835 [Planctomycetes bacterium]|nr:hypothetical protein [Planctomycetota bacterium]